MMAKNIADLEASMMLTKNVLYTHKMPTAAADLENVCDDAQKCFTLHTCPTRQ